MKHICLLVTNLWVCLTLFGQKFDHNWLTGYNEFPGVTNYGHALMRFEGDTVSIQKTDLAFNFESTVAVMSDSDGNLLFYSNGCDVSNRNHSVMPNGAGLNPGVLSDVVCPWKGYIVPQGAMALPWPGSPDKYCLLHIGASSDPVRKLKLTSFYYSVIDMSLQNGLGDVASKNNVLLDGDLGAFNVVRHGNGRDWWIAVPSFENKTWHFFLLTPNGLEVQNPQIWLPEMPDCEKYMATAIAPGGNKIASWGECKISVSDFDRCSGVLGNVYEMVTPTHWIPGGGLAFSPSGRYLYATSQNVLFRADLDMVTPKLDSVRFSYDPFLESPYYVPGNTFHFMTHGPDGYIYGNIPSRSKYLHCLKKPDEDSIDDLEFQAQGVKLPVYGVRTLPHFPNFRLYDMPDSPCDTLGISVSSETPDLSCVSEIRISPTPAQDLLHIRMPGCKISGLRIFDALGRWIQDVTTIPDDDKITLSIPDFLPGLYFMQFKTQTGGVAARSFIIF